MKVRFTILLCCLLGTCLMQCGKEEITARDYPRLSTLDVSDISPDGALFNAEISFRENFEIREWGFVWSNDYNPSLQNAERVIHTAPIKSDRFSAKITTTLLADKVYYVRSFVKTNTHTVYGQRVQFTSLGSNAPIISSVSPHMSSPGDTLLIRGKHFSYLNFSNWVYFSIEGTSRYTVVTNPSKSTDTLLNVVIPNLLVGNSYDISLKVNVLGQEVSHAQKLTIVRPVFPVAETHLTSFNQEVHIAGENLPLDPALIGVKVGNTNAMVTDVTRSGLTFVVPSDLYQSLNPISITISGTIYEVGTVKIKPPVITELSPAVFTTYETAPVSIKGSNFNPLRAKNKVFIGGWPCEILSSSWTELRVRLPRNLIPDREQSAEGVYDLEVQVLEQSITLPDAITIDYRK